MPELPLDHVAIAVRSIDEALPLFERLTGGRGSRPERVESQGVRLVFVGEGATRIELLEPLSAASPVARFLEQRGPGLHHIAYRVPDLEAALERLRTDGFRLTTEAPSRGAHGRIAFIHPKSAGGVLVELVEAPVDS